MSLVRKKPLNYQTEVLNHMWSIQITPSWPLPNMDARYATHHRRIHLDLDALL